MNHSQNMIVTLVAGQRYTSNIPLFEFEWLSFFSKKSATLFTCKFKGVKIIGSIIIKFKILESHHLSGYHP